MSAPEIPLDLSIPTTGEEGNGLARSRNVFSSVNLSRPLDLRMPPTSGRADNVRDRSRSPPLRLPLDFGKAITSRKSGATFFTTATQNWPSFDEFLVSDGHISHPRGRFDVVALRSQLIAEGSPRDEATLTNNPEPDVPSTSRNGAFASTPIVPTKATPATIAVDIVAVADPATSPATVPGNASLAAAVNETVPVADPATSPATVPGNASLAAAVNETFPGVDLPQKGKKYSKEDLQLALLKVRSGEMSKLQASKVYGIPRGTIQFRLGNKCKHKERSGPPTVLTSDEEKKLVTWLFEMQRKGFPVTAAGLQEKVFIFIKASPRPNRFKNGVPGKHWLTGFLKRHPDIAIRTPEGVSAASARVSESDLRGWFSFVWTYAIAERLMDAMLDPKRKINGDEIGFFLFQLAKKVLARKGSRDVMMVEAGDPRKNITVLFCFSADGDYFPPDIILPYERIPPEVVQSVPGSWGLGKSKSGWMDTKNFVLYIEKILHPTLVRKGVTFPVLFFVDGHRSHTAFAAAEACLKLGIVLIALYPNATRIIQPADVGVFGPLKQSWRKILTRMPPNEAVTLTSFADKLLLAMNEAFKPETIEAAFIECGIHPFDENAPNYNKCLAKSSQSGITQTTCDTPNQVLGDLTNVSFPAPDESCTVAEVESTVILLQSMEDSNPTQFDAAVESPLDDFESIVLGDDTTWTTNQPMREAEVVLSESAIAPADSGLAETIRAPVALTNVPRAVPVPLQDLTNTRTVTIDDFLTTPPTPKRKGKHINYKVRSNPILTAAERLEELRAVERQKELAQQQKEENARKREAKREEKEIDKKKREEARAKKKEERKAMLELQERLRLQKQAEKREKQEAKKQRKNPDEFFVRIR